MDADKNSTFKLWGAYATICAICLLTTVLAKQRVEGLGKELPKRLVAPSDKLKYFTLGYKDILADALWLRVLQDFDYCDGISVTAQAGKENQDGAPMCKEGWVFQMIDAITELAPRFRIAHTTGALNLTVIVDDVDGATKIFEKGIQRFSRDWVVLYRAAYHFMYEVGDLERAGVLLHKAAKNGAPQWIYALVARLHTEAGREALARAVLEDFIKQNPRSQYVTYFKDRLQNLKGLHEGSSLIDKAKSFNEDQENQ